MTGPEHYREAEFLLAAADAYEQDSAPLTAANRRAEAQVHATLAQVALTAMSQPISGMPDEPGLDQEEFDDWYAVVNGLPFGSESPSIADQPSASELHELDQADQLALDAAATAEFEQDTEGQR